MIADQCHTDANGGCSHICTVVEEEGVVCSCPAGYRLQPDGKTCLGECMVMCPINEATPEIQVHIKKVIQI